MAVISQSNVTRMSMIIEKVVTPDHSTLSGQIQDHFQKNQEISSFQNLTDPILDGISQEFTVKEDIAKPVKNTKLAGGINNFVIDKVKNEKLGKLIKTGIGNVFISSHNVDICILWICTYSNVIYAIYFA